jgi:hypothetical protein
MKELLQFAWDALLLKDEAYAQHVARADVLKRGLTLLVLVTLLAGVLPLVVDVIGDLRPMSAQRQEAERGIREFTTSMGPLWGALGVPPDFERELLDNLRTGMEMGFDIAELPTPLPKVVGGILENLGAFLSLPFSRLAVWIGYTLWVLLIAKFLDGKATLSQMLGTTALYAVPHVLDGLNFVPCLGSLLGLVATVWGIAIYVKAVAVANDFSIGRAIAATVIPVLIDVALVLLGLLALVIMALVTG